MARNTLPIETAERDLRRLLEVLVHLIEGLPRLHLVALDHALAQRASRVAREHRLRGADSVYVSVADAFDSRLIAWDAKLLERGAGVVTTMTPLEWMAEQGDISP